MSTNKHAQAQERYAVTKSKTYRRMCVWVPKGFEEAFKKSVARLQKKWLKDKP